MHTTMHSPKMTRSLQQISDKFGGSLPSVNRIPNKLQLGDKLHTVQVKVGVPLSLCPSVPVTMSVVEGSCWCCVMRDWETGRGHDRDEVISQDGHHN